MGGLEEREALSVSEKMFFSAKIKVDTIVLLEGKERHMTFLHEKLL